MYNLMFRGRRFYYLCLILVMTLAIIPISARSQSDSPVPFRIDPDDRGDVNLNGIAYELADFIVFSNYFIFGLEAFTIDTQHQTSATDVNADDLPLTLNDIVYLARVIEGVALPYPSEPPAARSDFAGVIALIDTDSSIIIRTDFEEPLGGLYFSFSAPDLQTFDDYTIKRFVPSEHMDFIYDTSDDMLNILITRLRPVPYVQDYKATVESGLVDVAEIVYTGSKPVLSHYEACGYLGETVDIALAALPNNPPIFDPYPDQIENSQDGSFYYDFNVQDNDGPSEWIEYNIINGPGTVNAETGEYYYSGVCADIGVHYTVEICATDVINPCPQANPDLHAVIELIVTNPTALPGDADRDGGIGLGDIVYIINYLYMGGLAPAPLKSADANNDDRVNILDALYLIYFSFKNGPEPSCD